MTAKEWLEVPDQDLPVKLAEVLAPGPWKHDMDSRRAGVCHKCKRLPDGYCPVPDPITIDWNTAMEWFRKVTKDEKMLSEVMDTITEKGDWSWFWIYHAQPKHYLIAAAMAAEGSKND